MLLSGSRYFRNSTVSWRNTTDSDGDGYNHVASENSENESEYLPATK